MGSRSDAAPFPAISLIPWDPANEFHFQRLVAQRHACGWDFDIVTQWRDKALQGDKLLFWIVLSGNEAAPLLDKHMAAYHTETSTLLDSVTQMGKTERKATLKEFLPVGHIALDAYPERNVLFGIPASTLWLKSLYISTAIQGGGLGNRVMKTAEAMAAAAPFQSAALALDTSEAAYQRRLKSNHLYGTDEPPVGSPPIMTNQEWYQRQGYVLMSLPAAGGEAEATCARLENRESLRYYVWLDTVSGELKHIPAVFLYKMMTKSI